MLDLRGRTVVLVGPFAGGPLRLAREAVVARGGVVRRAVVRGTDLLVVGAAAWPWLADGRLQRRIAAADAVGATSIGERAWLAALAGKDARPAGATLDLPGLLAASGLAAENARVLGLFGLVGPAEAGFGFADLATARHAARLLADGLGLAETVRGLLAVRQRERPLAELAALARDARGGVCVRSGEDVAEIDGQLRLPLADDPAPGPDELFELAEAAEQDGDAPGAAALYRRCLDLDRADPIAAYNLANLLRELGRPGEALAWLRHAVGLDPRFAEAWYNLADLEEARGDPAAAVLCLERVLAADRDYGDALYNLARLRFARGELADAAALWRRYLGVDRTGPWAERARAGLALCRMRAGPAG